jgi:ABC-type multidrug transport system fused ATPase/permease subunit
MQDRTTLVIAHRLATVRNADVIHVIEAGCVAESGTHDALLAKDGIYAGLYRLQFGREAEG